MRVTYNLNNSCGRFQIEKKRINALRVVGESIEQLVVKNSTCINAIKIVRIDAKLLESKDHFFRNKIIKHGTIQKEVFYVDPDNKLRYLTENVPFMLIIKMPGFEPTDFTKVHNQLLHIDVDYNLTPTNKCIPGCLRQIIVAHILVKACEWTQLDVVTQVDVYPKTYSSGIVYSSNYY